MPDRPLHVLLIDDSTADAFAIEQVLRELGAMVIERVDSEGGLRDALHRVRWDVVISEFAVPGIEALNALGWVRESRMDIPFIVVSGRIGEEAAAAVMRAGDQDFVSKANLARLGPAVGRELRTARLRGERRAAEARLQRLAHHDPLTDLPNRNLMYSRVGADLRRPSQRIAVLSIELGQFDDIRRALGPLHADRLVQEVVARLQTIVEPNWTLGRTERDTLALAVPRAGVTRAQAVAESVHEALAEPITDGAFRLRVSITIGIALGPGDAETPDGLLRMAGIAADYGRRTGRTTQIYGVQTDRYSRNRLSLIADLWHAGQRGEFELEFQPKVALSDGAPVSAEALLRWRRPDGPTLQPADFLRAAGESGSMRSVTEWVVPEALRTCRMWRDVGCTMNVTINVAAETGCDPTFPGWLATKMKEAGVSPGSVEIDLPEEALRRDHEGAMRTLRGFALLGVHAVVDDYGAGSSSLAALRDLPLGGLKIDRSFFSRGALAVRSRGIVEAAIAMAKSLSLEVTAEGIEDEPTFQWLKGAGCHAGQGYFIARPMAVAPLMVWASGVRVSAEA